MSEGAPAPPRRRRLWAVLAALALLLAVDLARPPREQLSARLLLGGLHLYQATLSPLLGRAGVRCRFTPSCSHYAEGAVANRGALQGSWLTLRRLVRCGPWTPAGTYDPPPPPRATKPAAAAPAPAEAPASGNIGRIDGGEVISVEQNRNLRLGHRGPTLT